MTDRKMSELIAFLLNEGGEDNAIVTLTDMIETLKLTEDKQYLDNLLMSLERSGILSIKYKKGEDFCITVLPKGKLFLKEKKDTEIDKEVKISISGKKLFLWAFLGSLCASTIVAMIAIILVKVL